MAPPKSDDVYLAPRPITESERTRLGGDRKHVLVRDSTRGNREIPPEGARFARPLPTDLARRLSDGDLVEVDPPAAAPKKKGS